MMDTINITREDAVKIALTFYLGEHCKFCGKEYKTLGDLQDVVYAGDHEHGRLACQSCWNEHAKAEDGE